MCLAIVKPAGVVIPHDHIYGAFSNNPDGAGFAVQYNGKVSIAKGFFTPEDFLWAWENHEKQSALLHFRLASAGDISQENCHPFRLVNGGALAHNGHFTGYDTHPSQSDTLHWITTVLNPLLRNYPDAFDVPSLRAMIESATQGSRVALLPRHGNAIVLHKREWMPVGKALYSNKSYLPQGWKWASAEPWARNEDPDQAPEGFCPVCSLDPEDCTCYFRD